MSGETEGLYSLRTPESREWWPLSDIVLRVHELQKTFDPGLFEARVHVLKGLSFEVQRGEVYGFLGPNGAGKTTAIKAITGLIFPDEGEITVCGRPHTDREAKRRIGFMPENPYFYNHLTGREFLGFHSELLILEPSRIEGRINEVLQLVSMAQHADRPMRTFSKGMLQRMALAQALLGEPEMLILDEPMSGLDPVGRRDVRDIILAQRDQGTTVFFSSHILPDVETICDRVAIVIDGTVQATGEVRELVAREVEAYELTFVGADPERLETEVLSFRTGSDASWARVAAEHRDELISELSAVDAQLVSLTPVRSSLEDLLLGHFQGRTT
jgi:ABC-2 type transport system ATP-binding protein